VEGIGRGLIWGSTQIGLKKLDKRAINLSQNSLLGHVSIIQRLSLPCISSLWPWCSV